jgi:hypothetical protein
VQQNAIEAWLFDGLVGHIGCAHRAGVVEDIIGRPASHFWNEEMLATAIATGLTPSAVIVGESSTFVLPGLRKADHLKGVPILVNHRLGDRTSRWPDNLRFDGSDWIPALVRFARDQLGYLNPRWKDTLTDPRLD